MFTGIIETLGNVIDIQPLDTTNSSTSQDNESTNLLISNQGYTITIGHCSSILSDCKLGDSISVNGTCLTVTEFNKDCFKVGLCPETLQKTNLGLLQLKDQVNLERALKVGESRFHGHWVQGHIDQCIELIYQKVVQDSMVYTFYVPPTPPRITSSFSSSSSSSLHPSPSLDPFQWIVPKGYVCLDGTSLTVCDVDPVLRTFTVTLIAYTLPRTILGQKRCKNRTPLSSDSMHDCKNKEHEFTLRSYEFTVNLEFDVMAKYLYQFCLPYFSFFNHMNAIPTIPTPLIPTINSTTPTTTTNTSSSTSISTTTPIKNASIPFLNLNDTNQVNEEA